MIIVKLCGGMGNQLFQYALYRKLQNIGRKAVCDIQPLQEIKKMGRPTIDIFPNVYLDVVDKENREQLGDVSRSIQSRFRRKFWHKKSHIYERESGKLLYFRPEVFRMDQVYLDGYWQSEKYFKDIRSQLLHEISFPEASRRRNQELAFLMENEVSVSVHVRKGDYLKGKNKETFGGVCTDTYYRKAIAYFIKKYPVVHFYFFSNAPEYFKGIHLNSNMTVVDWNYGAESYWDMYLMSKCHHNIIANSTFSWWGAWLNQHKEKEVVAPKYWFNPQVCIAEDTVCEEWIKMEA